MPFLLTSESAVYFFFASLKTRFIEDREYGQFVPGKIQSVRERDVCVAKSARLRFCLVTLNLWIIGDLLSSAE